MKLASVCIIAVLELITGKCTELNTLIFVVKIRLLDSLVVECWLRVRVYDLYDNNWQLF